MKRLAVAAMLAAVALCASSLAEDFYVWQWDPDYVRDSVWDGGQNDYDLTFLNGAHAVAVSGSWTNVAYSNVPLVDNPWGLPGVSGTQYLIPLT